MCESNTFIETNYQRKKPSYISPMSTRTSKQFISSKIRSPWEETLAASNSYWHLNSNNVRNNVRSKAMFSSSSLKMMDIMQGNYQQSNYEAMPKSKTILCPQPNTVMSYEDINFKIQDNALRELNQENLSVLHEKLISVKSSKRQTSKK